MTKRLDILVNLIKQGNGDKQAKAGLEGIQLSTKEAEISVKALDRRYSQLITEVSKGNKTVSQAQAEYRDFARQLGVVERASQDTNFSFTELNQAFEFGKSVLTGVADAAEIVFNEFQRAEEVRALRNTFDELSASIGDSEAILNGLKDATNGAVNETILLKAASKALNLGLAETDDELVTLVSNAAALGANLGDVGGTIDDVLAAIANESKLRLDNFGVAASRVEELQLELKAAGEEGTFAQATMIALNETVDRTGARANLAASDMSVLQAALQDARDEALLDLIAGFGDDLPDAIDKATGAIATFSESFDAQSVRDALTFLEFASKFTAPGFGKWVLDITGADDAIDSLKDTIRELTSGDPAYIASVQAQADANREAARAAADLNTETLDLTQAQFDALPPLRQSALLQSGYGEVLEDVAEATSEVNEEWRESVRQQQLLASRQQGLNQATQEGVGFVGDIRQGWVEYNDTIEESVEQTNDYRDSINEMAAAANSARQAEQDRIASLGDYATSIQLAADGTFSANDAIFAHIDALDASPEVTIAAGLALGVYTEAQARARIEGFLLEQELRRVEQAVADGRLTNDQGVDAFVGLATGVYDTATAAILANDAFLQNSSAIDDMEASALDVIPSLQSVEDKLLAVSGDAQAFADALNSIPTNIAVDILVRQSGQFTPPPSSTGPGPRHDGGPVAAGQPYLVGDGPGGSYIPGATELFIPSQSGHVVSNRQVEQAIASMSNSNNRSFTDRSSVTFNLRGSRSNLREARRQRHRRTARSMGKLING